MSSSLDRLSTELPNPRTTRIDSVDTRRVLELINDEDARVAPAVREALRDVARAVDLALDRWNRGGRIVLYGAGTSGRLAMLDAAELKPTFNVPPDRYIARMAGGPQAFQKPVEGAEDDRQAGAEAGADLDEHDLAFGISASGRTPWVLGALARAREAGSATIGLANVPDPELARHADVCIVVDTGPEAIAGSTRMKAGTAQKLVLNAFSSTLMIRLGKVYGNLMVDVQATNAKLRQRASRLVQQSTGADAETAARALLDADWDVKVAIAQLRLNIMPGDARARLEAVNGQLRRVLGEDDTAN